MGERSQLIEQKRSPKTLFQGLHLQGSLFQLKWNLSTDKKIPLSNSMKKGSVITSNCGIYTKFVDIGFGEWRLICLSRVGFNPQLAHFWGFRAWKNSLQCTEHKGISFLLYVSTILQWSNSASCSELPTEVCSLLDWQSSSAHFKANETLSSVANQSHRGMRVKIIGGAHQHWSTVITGS